MKYYIIPMDLKSCLGGYNAYLINYLWENKIKLIAFFALTIFLYFNISGLEKIQKKYELKSEFGGDRVLSSEKVREMMEENNFDHIIDVRSPEEYGLGSVSGSINVDHKLLLNEHPSVELSKHGVGKDDVVLVYCRSGNRAGKVVRHMLEDKYKLENIYLTTHNFKEIQTRQDK